MKMKKMMVVALVALVVSVSSICSVFAADDIITFSFTTGAPEGGIQAGYFVMSLAEYTFEEGDMVQYDVFIESENAGLGAFDVHVEGDITFRDSGALDTEGVMVHPTGVVLTDKAYQQWYTRKIVVPAQAYGKKSTAWVLSFAYMNQTMVGENENFVARYDNIKVVDSEGNVKFTLYENGPLENITEVFKAGVKSYDIITEVKPGTEQDKTGENNAADEGSSSNGSAGNPETSDPGMIMYFVLAGAAAGGLVIAKKVRKR